jgi:antitoxin YefM
MAHRTTYTAARANFATLCDRVTEDREVIIINRRNSRDVALVAADELSGLLETAHLLRSPKNAQRLLTALNRAKENKSKPQSLEKLRKEMGLDSRE